MRRITRRHRPALALLALFFTAAAASVAAPSVTIAAEAPLATIVYTSGPFTLSRDGQPVAAKDIGDPIFDDDYLATGTGGRVTIEFSPETGMRGSLTLGQKSSLYLRLDMLGGERQNQADLIAGQVALKVRKLVGSPGLTVTTDNTSCGVRGTEFEVTTSPDGALIVACTEGAVSCDSEGSSTLAVPGQIVEKRIGARLERRAVALEAYGKFRDGWLSDREDEFRRNAARTAPILVSRYLELQGKLDKALRLMEADKDLQAWKAERQKGKAPLGNPEELDKDMARVAKRLEAAKELLGAIERVAARITALEEIAKDNPAILALPARPGLSVGQFLSRFHRESAQDFFRAAQVRGGFKVLRERKNAIERRAAGQRPGSEDGTRPAGAPPGAAPTMATPSPAEASPSWTPTCWPGNQASPTARVS